MSDLDLEQRVAALVGCDDPDCCSNWHSGPDDDVEVAREVIALVRAADEIRARKRKDAR